MKVLFVAAECAPFIKSGGLGDVIGSLPRALKNKGIDVRVIMPKYSDIKNEYREKIITKKEITVPVGWRKQYCGIGELKHDDIDYYFLDNEYYFKRNGLYGFYDDGERYAYFSRAVLESLPYLDFKPDIIHCHDWHTAMVSVLFDAKFRDKPYFKDIKTVFSIHNLKYQGVFAKDILKDLCDLGDEYFSIDKLEFYGGINFMKGGIVFSDLITTVSESYAEEIKYPFYGENLDGLLREKDYKLEGIVNGLDYEKYNPENDTSIFENYHNSLEKKINNKTKLQSLLGLPVRRDVPVLSIVSRLVAQKGLDLLERILDEVLQMDIQMIILGTGEKRFEDLFRYFSGKYPEKLSANITFSEELAHKIYAGSDIFLMPSLFEPCGLGQLIALRYGTLPLVRETGGLRDTVLSYNEYTNEGNGFSFSNYNAHDFLFTIKRAINFYHNQDIWSKLFLRAVNEDYSWEKSSLKYKTCYQKLLNY